MSSFPFKIELNDEPDELVMAIQVTRHGARATANHIDFPDITKEEWKQGIGELTGLGERQHYLVAKKNVQKYRDQLNFLSSTFNPKEFLVYSTAVNRTLMSAYSELPGWYPLGSAEKLEQGETTQATPPFDFPGRDGIITDLGLSATFADFQPVPIHNGLDAENIMVAMNHCPYVKELYKKARKTETFRKTNEIYKPNILKSIHDDWGVPKELDFATVDPYTDSYYSAWFDDRLKPEFLLDNDKIDTMFADRFYKYSYYLDEAIRLVSTNFINFIYTKFDSKIKAVETGMDDGTGILDLKLIFMSAHDSSIAAFMAGVEQPQELQPFYASTIHVELWKKNEETERPEDQYYAKWIYNDGALNINMTCDEAGFCPYPKFKTYLQSRELDGDWETV